MSNTVTVATEDLIVIEGLGIYLRAGYDGESGQPFVTINTEDLKSAHRYDESTGLRGDEKPYVPKAIEGSATGYVVEGPDGTVASFNGHQRGMSNRSMAHTFAKVLNDAWAEQCGIPILHVMLNDADLYDDAGKGDTIDLAGREVYAVRPGDMSDDLALFASEEDAHAYANTFEADNVGDVEVITIASREVAAEMIAERIEEEDPGDPNGLGVDKLVATLNRLGFPSAADDAEEGVPANIIAARLREQGEHDAANELSVFGFDGEIN